MEWEILSDEAFTQWLDAQDAGLRQEVVAHANLLKQYGPMLGRPRVDSIKGSKLPNMKELRIQWRGQPWRVLFAFDPKRRAFCWSGAISKATSDGTRKISPLPMQDLKNT